MITLFAKMKSARPNTWNCSNTSQKSRKHAVQSAWIHSVFSRLLFRQSAVNKLSISRIKTQKKSTSLRTKDKRKKKKMYFQDTFSIRAAYSNGWNKQAQKISSSVQCAEEVWFRNKLMFD